MDLGQKLLARKQEIEQIIKKKQEALAIPMAEMTDELSMYDQHPADSASELYEREKDAGLLELLEIELEKTNDAIEKYNQGQYGTCERCGQPIAEGRLKRLVNTTLCTECARYLPETIRPTEEYVNSPGNMVNEGEAFQIAGYEFYEE